jgi:hypothetical protein
MATYSAGVSNSTLGNKAMTIKIYRGSCTRTATSVSFKFGVAFTPGGSSSSWSSNSVAAWYGGVQRFANVTRGSSDGSKVYGGTTYHAYYSNRDKSGNYTSENLCFSFSKTNISATTSSVTVTVGLGWADWAGSNQGSLDFSLSIPQFYGDVGTGTTTITDNYNNTFKITAAKGANGTNNNATGPTNLTWGYSTSYGTAYTSGSNIDLTLSGTVNTRTVYAKSETGHTTTPTSGSGNKSATTSKAIRQYKEPKAAGTPTLAASSYKNGRLTIKQDWTYTWTASAPGTGTASDTSSPVKGYKIQLFKKTPTATAFTQIAIKNSSNTKLGDSSNNYYANITSLTFSPSKSGIQPGDQVKLTIKPYTKYGLNNDGGSLYGSEVSSATPTVQNAGVMRVKVKTGGTAARPTLEWREGVVWVKVNKGTAAKPNLQWVEADIVKTKINTGTAAKPNYVWKESN